MLFIKTKEVEVPQSTLSMTIQQLEAAEVNYWHTLFFSNPNNSLAKFGNVLYCSKSEVDLLPFNRVFGITNPEWIKESNLYRVIDFFSIRGPKKCMIQLPPNVLNNSTEMLIEEVGFKKHSQSVKMLFDLSDIKSQFGSEISISEITEESKSVFEHILTESNNWSKEMGEFYGNTLGQEGFKHFVARFQNKPVGVAVLYVRNGMGSLVISATLKEFRGLGVYKALVNKRLVVAKEMDCQFVSADINEHSESHSILKRAGFDEVYSKTNYVFEFQY